MSGCLFPGLYPGRDYSLRWHEVNSKYVTRLVTLDGPLLSPSHFFAVRADRLYVDGLEQKFSPFYNQELNELFLDHSRTLDIEELATQIFSGELPLPLIKKPDFSGLALGIFHIEDADNFYLLTFKRPTRDDLISGAQLYLEQQGYIDLCEKEDNIIQFKIEKDPNTLRDLFGYGLVKHYDLLLKKWVYDPGIIESTLPLFKENGGVVETRHKIIGDTRSGEIMRIQHVNTRFGGSDYFANRKYLQNPDIGELKEKWRKYKVLSKAAKIHPLRFAWRVNNDLKSFWGHAIPALNSYQLIYPDIIEMEVDLAYKAPKLERFNTEFRIEYGKRPA